MAFLNKSVFCRTKYVLVWTRLFNGPFWGVLLILPMILYKKMAATPLQIACLCAIKPVSALLAPYWSQKVHHRLEHCKKNLILANILRYIPFLCMPWIHSVWVILVMFGWYMALHRGMLPAWTEIIKMSALPDKRAGLMGHGTALDHAFGAIFPVALGVLLDTYEDVWLWMFVLTACCGLVSTLFLCFLPDQVSLPCMNSMNFKKNFISDPWKNYCVVLKNHRDFFHFQIGFMLGGAGLMLVQPSLPLFFMDVLKLSYTKLSIAMTVCKGIGFVCTTPLWVKMFDRMNIYRFSAVVVGIASLFPLLLFIVPWHGFLLYLAFMIYGVMQAGSELSWHMSGPIFSREGSSTLFSEANVLAVGIRGCIVPFLGMILLTYVHSSIVMIMGSLLCAFAAHHFMRYHFLTSNIKD